MRYRLIQILEILLWLGAVAGIAMVARRVWGLREQGYGVMLDAATPGLLAIGAGMAALIVLIGIYHNSRRTAQAMDLMSRQSAGGMRRLPGAQRGEVPAAVMPAPMVAAPAPMPVAAPVATAPVPVAAQPSPVVTAPAPMPVAAPVAPPIAAAAPVAPPAPAPVFTTPTMVEPEPAPVTPHVAPANSVMPDLRPAPQRLRAGIRRLGPAT